MTSPEPRVTPATPEPTQVRTPGPPAEATPRGGRLGAFTRRTPLEERIRSADWALAALFIVASAVALAFFPDQLLPILGGITALVGGGKLIARHVGDRENDELPPATPTFRALADPARPLGPGDPVSRPLPRATASELPPPQPERAGRDPAA